MPKIRRYLDWRGYAEGLYLSWVKNLTSALIALGGTNAADAMGLNGIGLNWQQFLGVLASITFWEVVRYVNAKPKPETVTETIDTQHITTP